MARALALHARGHRFDSDILHLFYRITVEFIDMLKSESRNEKSRGMNTRDRFINKKLRAYGECLGSQRR